MELQSGKISLSAQKYFFFLFTLNKIPRYTSRLSQLRNQIQTGESCNFTFNEMIFKNPDEVWWLISRSGIKNFVTDSNIRMLIKWVRHVWSQQERLNIYKECHPGLLYSSSDVNTPFLVICSFKPTSQTDTRINQSNMQYFPRCDPSHDVCLDISEAGDEDAVTALLTSSQRTSEVRTAGQKNIMETSPWQSQG